MQDQFTQMAETLRSQTKEIQTLRGELKAARFYVYYTHRKSSSEYDFKKYFITLGFSHLQTFDEIQPFLQQRYEQLLRLNGNDRKQQIDDAFHTLRSRYDFNRYMEECHSKATADANDFA